MEYRKLPHGEEQIGVLGLGMGGIQNAPDEEIERVVRTALAHGTNFFDLCGGAANHYSKLAVKAGACTACGHCDRRCPFRVAQSERMAEIAACFAEK